MVPRSDPDIAAVAVLIGDPARAAMLSALLGGAPLTAGELARRARVQPSTASGHLARLTAARLVTRQRDGRHVRYALASEDVAAALESLARIAVPPGAARAAAVDSPGSTESSALRFARTCYDHLAGRLGIQLADALVEQRLITRRSYNLTANGEQWLNDFGIDTAALRRGRRPLTRPCLDWSERRDHLAGAVGAALTATMLERRWITRLEGTRAVRLTLRGRDGLGRVLGADIG
jgi:DNA-binding transcriptional ArsR family regulator